MTPHQACFPIRQHEAVTLAAVPNAVSLARRLVAEVTRHWCLPDELIEGTVLITSELVTNAIKATDVFHQATGVSEIGRVKLRLRLNRPSLFTEVWDINPVLPTKRRADALDTNGRGLGIIECLCVNWSAAHCRQGGKLVRAEQRLAL
ncbi:ATP-binding protein [Actinoallomurus rhizosphaericola]|uniref:ATP-binding protein n=1 Tax=Actinoallomurus rhizosphaericola TaxID=2952536 RepID=UPI002092BB66|nr:ATP-binding protein [Actinoallomurus rhizosphaericola]MCO5998923.1 ATP-binding protein [Actinoallomurus rhizosphaericola]